MLVVPAPSRCTVLSAPLHTAHRSSGTCDPEQQGQQKLNLLPFSCFVVSVPVCGLRHSCVFPLGSIAACSEACGAGMSFSIYFFPRVRTSDVHDQDHSPAIQTQPASRELQRGLLMATSPVLSSVGVWIYVLVGCWAWCSHHGGMVEYSPPPPVW